MEKIKQLVYSRELRWNEVLTAGMALFHANFKVILWGIVLICLPISLLEAIVQMRLMNIDQLVFQAGAMLSVEQAQTYLAQMGINYVFVMLISVFLMPIFIIGVAKAAKWRMEGRKVEASTAFTKAMLLEPSIVKVGIVYLPLVIIATLLFAIPGIYISVIWCLYLYCIALGGRRGLDALGHSRLLVRERWWRTFGFLILLNFVVMGWSSLVSLLFTSLPNSIPVHTIMNCLLHIADAYVACQLAVVFLNRESGLCGMDSLQEEEEIAPAEVQKAAVQMPEQPAEKQETPIEPETNEKPQEDTKE